MLLFKTFGLWMKDRVHCWRHGVRRVAPGNVRGRVYEIREGRSGGSLGPKAKAVPKITMRARVIRKDGSVEDKGVIAQS